LVATLSTAPPEPASTLRSRVLRLLESRTFWLTDARRTLQGAVSEAPALVVFVGREHYVEKRKRYPIRGWRDLDRVLKLELAGDTRTLTAIGPPEGDAREVVFYQLKPGVAERLGRTVLAVPESAALAGSAGEDAVVTVERDGFRYFLGDSGESQPAAGAIGSVALFSMAIGLSPDSVRGTWDRDAIVQRLLPGLWRMPRASLLRFLRPTLQGSLQVAWKPLALLAGAGLVGYLLLASAYLSLTLRAREAALEDLGPEVEQLLGTQREVEQLAAERTAVAELLAGRRDTYEIWRLAATAWQQGASLNGLQFVDGRVTLRGAAPTATDVLASLAKVPGASDVRFALPVRREGANEAFVIELKLAAAAAEAGGSATSPAPNAGPSPGTAPGASSGTSPGASSATSSGTAPGAPASVPAAAPTPSAARPSPAGGTSAGATSTPKGTSAAPPPELPTISLDELKQLQQAQGLQRAEQAPGGLPPGGAAPTQEPRR
jgi:hypothetical protein